LKNQKRYTQGSLKRIIQTSIIVLPIISLFFFQSSDKSISYIIGVIFLTYMLIINKEVVVTSRDLLIYYTLFPIIKYRYPLKNISKVRPYFLGGLGNDEALKISLKSGKRKTFYLSMEKDFQRFFDDLRQYNIEVDTGKHSKFK